jgi:hypothetical protein
MKDICIYIYIYMYFFYSTLDMHDNNEDDNEVVIMYDTVINRVIIEVEKLKVAYTCLSIKIHTFK